MKKLFATCFTAALLVAGSVAAQQVSLAGHTDQKGTPLPGGDTRISFSAVNKDYATSITMQKLYAYNNQGKRLAELSKDPKFFEGAQAHVMFLGDMYGDTGANVEHVDLRKAKGMAPINVSGDTVTIPFNTEKFACVPMNYVLSRNGKPFAWLGHTGWAKDNKATGAWTILAQNDHRYPATVACNKAGVMVPADEFKPGLKAEYARILQPPNVTDKDM